MRFRIYNVYTKSDIGIVVSKMPQQRPSKS